MMRLLMLLLLCASRAWAGVDEDFARKLAHARSRIEIESLQRRFEALKIARVACRMQIQATQIPYACYEALRAEVDWGLHASRTEQARIRTRLDDLCSNAAQELRVAQQIPKESSVSSACRADVRRAHEIQNYRRGMSDGPGFEL